MMKKDVTKKILDKEKQISKRFSALCKFVDGQGEEEVRNFFSANYSTIYSIYLDYLQKVDHTAKQKKRSIDTKEVVHLCEILSTLFKHNTTIIRGKWQLKSITHQLENLLEPRNTHAIRKLGFDLLLQFVDILGNRADMKHLSLVMTVLDFTPFIKDGQNVVLPSFEKRPETEVPSLPQRPETAPSASKEETLDMIQIMFKFFKNPSRFPFWWDFFKSRIAIILYPQECQALQLLETRDGTGFRDGCPADIHVHVLRMLLECLGSPQISAILYEQDVDVFLIIAYLFRQSFMLPPEYWEDLNNQLQAYRAWILKDVALYTAPDRKSVV